MGENNGETSIGAHVGEKLAQRLEKKGREKMELEYQKLVDDINTGTPPNEVRDKALDLAHKLGKNPTRLEMCFMLRFGYETEKHGCKYNEA
jgi:hypothetical protein